MYKNNTIKHDILSPKYIISKPTKRHDAEYLIIYSVSDGHRQGASRGIEGHRNSFSQGVRGIEGASRGIGVQETQGIKGIEPGEVYCFKILKGNRTGRGGMWSVKHCVHVSRILPRRLSTWTPGGAFG